MNKVVIIGIIVTIGIIFGISALIQENQSGDIVSIDVGNTEREPTNFTIGLSESVGMEETP